MVSKIKEIKPNNSMEILKKTLSEKINLDDYLDFLLKENEEIIEKMPREIGLRRLVESYLGKIISIKTTINSSSIQYVSATVTIIIDGVGEYSGSADATESNTREGFGNYLAAMAETRARARAFRTALGIQRCSKEEIGESKTPKAKEEAYDNKPYMNNIVLNFARNNNLDIEKFSIDMFSKNFMALDPQERQMVYNKMKEIVGAK